jgi:hypothetical protein
VRALDRKLVRDLRHRGVFATMGIYRRATRLRACFSVLSGHRCLSNDKFSPPCATERRNRVFQTRMVH